MQVPQHPIQGAFGSLKEKTHHYKCLSGVAIVLAMRYKSSLFVTFQQCFFCITRNLDEPSFKELSFNYQLTHTKK